MQQAVGRRGGGRRRRRGARRQRGEQPAGGDGQQAADGTVRVFQRDRRGRFCHVVAQRKPAGSRLLVDFGIATAYQEKATDQPAAWFPRCIAGTERKSRVQRGAARPSSSRRPRLLLKETPESSDRAP
ncbi:hypothetical protein [Burkholderia stagnalis]|uniref:hypothetical protein n=1 Tax=Burkholderia stagnalis TaxID=1503054 RepID=UPI001E3F7E01|nr:hypothetical protein [Burkholderia stagnalis]